MKNLLFQFPIDGLLGLSGSQQLSETKSETVEFGTMHYPWHLQLSSE